MDSLEKWLQKATCGLSKESAIQVRAEIREHYDISRDANLGRGMTADQAAAAALLDLGGASEANKLYRRVLLTNREARLLRNGSYEARAICARPALKWSLTLLPILAFWLAVGLFLTGRIDIARTAFAAALGLGLCFVAPFLPLYTGMRSRIFRWIKWISLPSVLLLAFGKDAMKMSWLLFPCLSTVAWIEWTRISIRRKLPISKWPRHLYL